MYCRLCCFGDTPQPVMCGVMVLFCMRCGVLERDPMEIMTIVRLVENASLLVHNVTIDRYPVHSHVLNQLHDDVTCNNSQHSYS